MLLLDLEKSDWLFIKETQSLSLRIIHVNKRALFAERVNINAWCDCSDKKRLFEVFFL